jgi:hypothetical protein
MARKSYLKRPADGDTMYFREDQCVGDDGADMEQASVGYYVLGGHYVPMWCYPLGF